MSFLDQLGKMVTPPAASPTAALPPYLADLNQSINGIHGKISDMFFELGQAYYERYVNDQQTEFEDRMAAIRAAYAEIAQYQSLADDVGARKRCPNCGAQLMNGAAFCSSCGARLP